MAAGALYALGFHEANNEDSIARFDEAISFGTAHGLSTLEARVGRSGTTSPREDGTRSWRKRRHCGSWPTSVGTSSAAWIVEYHVSMIRLERGERIGLQDDLLEGARAHGFPIIFIAPLAAGAARVEGKPEYARRIVQEALDATPPGEVDSVAHFVLACLLIDAPDLARRALALGAVPDPMNDAETLLANALLAEVDGDFLTAQREFERAEAAFAALGWVPYRAHALAGLGRCLVAMQDTRAGRSKLGEARDLWRRVDVKPRIAEIDELLATISISDGGSA